jgi:hypothetical protein
MVSRGAYPIYRAISTCSSWTRPRLTHTNRSALWQDDGSKRWAFSELEWKPRFKKSRNEICLLYSTLFWNFNKRPNPISRLVSKQNLSRSMYFLLIRLDLALHIVPRIQYLGFTLKGRRVPWLWWRTCPLASPNELRYDNQPSTVAFLGNVLEAARWFKLIAPSSPPGSPWLP